jgi:hypothetical protein
LFKDALYTYVDGDLGAGDGVTGVLGAVVEAGGDGLAGSAKTVVVRVGAGLELKERN